MSKARIYAIRELARRAGVSEEFFRTWRFEGEGRWTSVRLESGANKMLRFPDATTNRDGKPGQLRRSVARAKWTYEPDGNLGKWVPEFIVPFVAEAEDEPGPIFRVQDDCVEFKWDLPTAALWTLCRVEESASSERDPHGRFPASASIAAQFDFLSRPIVDEYGLALEQALRRLLPRWQPKSRRLMAKLSHDIDDVGIPFNLRATAAHTLRRNSPSASMSDLISLVTDRSPAYLEAVEQLAQFSLDHGLDSAFYWKASKATPNDSGYDPRHPKVRKVIAGLLRRGIECGIHPGYDTFEAVEGLNQEVRILTEVFGRMPVGGRQHYLRWRPETWLHWEASGLRYDSTVGFADRIGFRAGTCLPYRPWLFSENRPADLLEIPLIVMDVTLTGYMGLSVERSFDLTKECIERCRVAGGVFTLLWHNTSLLNPAFGDLYPQLLNLLSGAESFSRSKDVDV